MDFAIFIFGCFFSLVSKVSYIDPLFVLAFLKDNNIMERFISIVHSHEEIPRQGAPLLNFLAHHGQITEEHLDLIWQGMSPASFLFSLFFFLTQPRFSWHS